MQSVSSIELDALPPAVRRDVLFALEQAMERHAFKLEVEGIRQSNPTDAEIIAFAEREYGRAPIGLSTWYPDGISWGQETRLGLEIGQQRKRPVFLRGSLKLCIERHSLSPTGRSVNGWAIELFWRFVRAAKLTALTWEEFEDWATQVQQRVARKYPYVTSAFWDKTGRWFIPVVGGRRVELTRDQLAHIRALREIARKTERLDSMAKRAMVRQLMLERLAA